MKQFIVSSVLDRQMLKFSERTVVFRRTACSVDMQ